MKLQEEMFALAENQRLDEQKAFLVQFLLRAGKKGQIEMEKIIDKAKSNVETNHDLPNEP